MLVREQCMGISILHKQGLSNRKIAKLMGISRNTVKKYLASLNPSIYKTRPPQSTKLSPCHDYLRQRPHGALKGKTPSQIDSALCNKNPLQEEVESLYEVTKEHVQSANSALEMQLRNLKDKAHLKKQLEH